MASRLVFQSSCFEARDHWPMCYQRVSQLDLASRFFAASPYLDLTNLARAFRMLNYGSDNPYQRSRGRKGAAVAEADRKMTGIPSSTTEGEGVLPWKVGRWPTE